MSTNTPASAIRLDGVTKHYRATGSFFGLTSTRIPAVRGVSLDVPVGSSFGLVGQSGSGKSTLARLVAGLEAPDSGAIELLGAAMPTRRDAAWRALRRQVQVVFQDPYAALDPLMCIGDAIAEPLVNLAQLTRAERDAKVAEVLAAVRLPARIATAYPYQLSGGERQRVCIARALVLRPDVVICDEAVSALDAQTQSHIVELLRELQAAYQLTYFFISHDVAIVSRLCDTVAVMKDGELVETGPCRQVLNAPSHPYTRALVDAALYLQQGRHRSPSEAPLLR